MGENLYGIVLLSHQTQTNNYGIVLLHSVFTTIIYGPYYILLIYCKLLWLSHKKITVFYGITSDIVAIYMQNSFEQLFSMSITLNGFHNIVAVLHSLINNLMDHFCSLVSNKSKRFPNQSDVLGDMGN